MARRTEAAELGGLGAEARICPRRHPFRVGATVSHHRAELAGHARVGLRGDGVHTDPIPSALRLDAVHEPDHGQLGGAVGSGAHCAEEPPTRRK